jgi:hypothetical protein
VSGSRISHTRWTQDRSAGTYAGVSGLQLADRGTQHVGRVTISVVGMHIARAPCRLVAGIASRTRLAARGGGHALPTVGQCSNQSVIAVTETYQSEV